MQTGNSAIRTAVIVPCFNGEKYIAETLRSIQSQTADNWKCIVVDDGSTDHSAEIVKKTAGSDPRFEYFYQENRGLPSARNTGIRLCESEYVQLLDADDLIDPDKIRIQADCLDANPAYDLITGPVKFINADGMPVSVQNASRIPDSAFTDNQPISLTSYVVSNPLPVNTYLFRRNAWLKIGGFDEGLFFYEDWDFWLRCLLSGSKPFYSAQNASAIVRCHKESMIHNKAGMLDALCRVRHKLLKSDLQLPLKILNSLLLIKDRMRYIRAEYLSVRKGRV